MREGVPVTDLAAQLGHCKKSMTLANLLACPSERGVAPKGSHALKQMGAVRRSSAPTPWVRGSTYLDAVEATFLAFAVDTGCRGFTP